MADIDEDQPTTAELVERFAEALEILSRYRHQQHSVQNSALGSQDVLEMARAVVAITKTAEPGRTVDEYERQHVAKAARAAGQLLAEQKDRMAAALE